ncbi:MAG: TAXI family TRAP transporter solute-binding subunit, partial [Clostridia bacterium]|nr:TAXI family TRAP transporter solute-binding subunit [Clostridia bacterium]
GSGVYYNATQILAAAGLDIDADINKTAASFGDAATLLKDGAIDAAFITAGTPTPAVSDLATSTDIVAVDLGEEVIAKLMNDYPFYAKHEYTSADYSFIADDETATTVAIMATFIVTNDMSEDQVYDITKNLWEKQDEIAVAHAKGKEMDKETAAAAIGNVPLHPGAEKYYKEIGVIA